MYNALFYLLVVDNMLLLLLQYIGKYCVLINLNSRSHDLFLIGFLIRITIYTRRNIIVINSYHDMIYN